MRICLLSDTWKIRHCQGAKAQFRLCPRKNGDKTVTNPSLKAGVSGYTPYFGFSPDGTTTCLRADSLRQARSCSCYFISSHYTCYTNNPSPPCRLFCLFLRKHFHLFTFPLQHYLPYIFLLTLFNRHRLLRRSVPLLIYRNHILACVKAFAKFKEPVFIRNSSVSHVLNFS